MASTIINAEPFAEAMGKVLHDEMIKAAHREMVDDLWEITFTTGKV